jgi:FKBP-type peptidyl-prolyl cis-trans isomerase
MLALVASLLVLLAAAVAPAQEVPLRTEEEKTFYALGLALAKDMEIYALGRKELPFVMSGFADGTLGRPARVPLSQYQQKIAGLARSRSAQLEINRSMDFVEKAAAEEGAVRTPSGLVFRELRAGKGARPGADSTVRLHYHGTLRDGTTFDSTRGMSPATVPLKSAIPCWSEALERMRVGGKAKIVCPPDLAFGVKGAANVAPGAAVAFEIELLDVVQ